MNFDETQQTLEILTMGFYLCLALMFVFLLVTMVMFWRFDILGLLRERTGIAAKRSAAAFVEKNARTSGVLSASAEKNFNDSLSDTASPTFLTKQWKRTEDVARRKLSGRQNRESDNTDKLPSQKLKNESPNAFFTQAPTAGDKAALAGATSADTDLLVAAAESGTDTDMLVGGTELLEAEFVLEKEVLVVHTDAQLDQQQK